MPSTKLTSTDDAAFRRALRQQGLTNRDLLRGDTAFLGPLRVQKTMAGYVVAWAGRAPMATYEFVEPAVAHAHYLYEEAMDWFAELVGRLGWDSAARPDHFLLGPASFPRARRRVRFAFDPEAAYLRVAHRRFCIRGDMNDRFGREAAFTGMAALLGEQIA